MFASPALLASGLFSLSSGITLVAEKAAGQGFDPLTLIGTTVTPVIVILLLLTDRLVTGSTHKRVLEENKQLRDELKELRETSAHELNEVRTRTEDKTIPALTKTALVLEAILPMMNKFMQIKVQGDSGGD